MSQNYFHVLIIYNSLFYFIQL